MKKDKAYRARMDARKKERTERPIKKIAEALELTNRRNATIERRKINKAEILALAAGVAMAETTSMTRGRLPDMTREEKLAILKEIK